MKINSSSSNCGLLDELIGQAQAMVCNDSSRRQASFGSQEEKHMLSDFELFLSGSSTNPPFVSGPQWADSTSLQPSTGKLLVWTLSPSLSSACFHLLAVC